MNAKEAVALRIEGLCRRRGLTVNSLADLCGVPPSTVYSMLNQKSMNPGIVTIQKVCKGLRISMKTFFDDPLFDHIEVVEKH